MDKLTPAQTKLLELIDERTQEGDRLWLDHNERRSAAVLERLGLVRVKYEGGDYLAERV